METWFGHLRQAYNKRPAIALVIIGLLTIFGARFAGGGWWQSVLVNIGTALLLIPPIVVTELILSKEVKDVRNTLETRLDELRKIATQYDYAREALPPSGERTAHFEQIYSEFMEQAKYTDINAKKARDLFKLPYGDRLIVLASAQVKQDPALFPQVIEAIEHSITAFEQYKALVAAKGMLTKLSEEQKQRLVDVINENPWIREDNPDRWAVSRSILKD